MNGNLLYPDRMLVTGPNNSGTPSTAVRRHSVYVTGIDSISAFLLRDLSGRVTFFQISQEKKWIVAKLCKNLSITMSWQHNISAEFHTVALKHVLLKVVLYFKIQHLTLSFKIWWFLQNLSNGSCV